MTRSVFLAAVLVFLFAGFLYHWGILSPVMTRQRRLVRQIGKMEADLVQMNSLKNEWARIKHRRGEAERRIRQKGKAFSLLAFLEGVGRAVGVDRKIQYMKPFSQPNVEEVIRSQGIEMGIEGVKMAELVRFLHRVEYSGKLLCINRIKIQKSPQDTSLKITLQVTSYSGS